MSPSPRPDNHISFGEVFRSELQLLKQRWANRFTGDRAGERSAAEGEEPTTEHGLVGLGFSGGGIRSATFNLGVLQALVRRGVFDHVDYLSSVSGGGYLSSSVSAGMRNAGEEFPLEYEWGAQEKAQVNWLRNNSSYMTTKGLVDWGRIVAVFVRGILLNWLTLVSWIFFAVLLVDLLYGASLRDWSGGSVDWSESFRYTRWALVGVGTYFVLYAPAVTFYRLFLTRRTAGGGTESSLGMRDRVELSFSYLLFGLVGVMVFELLPIVIHHYHELLRNPEANAELLTGIGGTVSVVAGAAVSQISGALSGILRTVAVYVVGILGMLLPVLVVLLVAENVVFDNGLLYDLAASMGMGDNLFALLCGFALLVFCYLFVDINLTSIHGLYRDRLANAYMIGKNTDDSVAVEQDLRFSELNRSGSVAPYHLVNTAVNLQGSSDPNIRERVSSHFIFSREFIGGEHSGYAKTADLEAVYPQVTLASGMAISAAAASPNMGSFTNGFLTALMTLLNIRMGYWCPNPGRLTPWAVNKGRPWERGRQGLVEAVLQRLRWRVPPRMLLREMAGAVHDDGDWVNVSDGGHIENMAAVELLRRRCKYVIVGDGEADPNMWFNGLAVLMRTARLDLGVEIRLMVDDLRLGEEDEEGKKYSDQHCAVGRIIYPPLTPGGEPEEGWLLYIKLSVTGDEDEMMREYRSRNPDFPHESTADQFFDEGQFEAYRSLGFHVGDRLFAPLHADAGRQVMSHAQLGDWFMELLESLAPRRAAADLEDEMQAGLASIESDMATNWYKNGLKADSGMQAGGPLSFGLDEDELDDQEPPSAEAVALVIKQIDIMQKAFDSLGLAEPMHRKHGGNARWMRTFTEWTAAPVFAQVWTEEKPAYSKDFGAFVDALIGERERSKDS